MTLSDKLKSCQEELKLLINGAQKEISNSVFKNEPSLSKVTYHNIKQTLQKVSEWKKLSSDIQMPVNPALVASLGSNLMSQFPKYPLNNETQD